MILLAGLGNPGAKYASNRHNIGFMAIDRIAHAHGAGPFKSKHGGALSELRLGASKVMLFKPESYMNRSGQPIGELMRWLKIGPEALVVFHDELDLAPGKLRVKRGGGHAGHNGLRSIHGHLGAEYGRVRLGVGHPGDKALVANYVLSDFAKADSAWLEPLLDAVAEASPLLADKDLDGFQAKTASLRQPKKSAPQQAQRPQQPPPKTVLGEEPDRSPLQKLMDRFGKAAR